MLFNVISSRLDPRIWILANESHFIFVNCIEIIELVSEWLLFNAIWAIFKLYYNKNKLYSKRLWWRWWYDDDNDIHFVLEQPA